MSKCGMGQGRVASSWISRTRKDGHAEITAAMTASTAVRVAHVSFDFGPTSKNETKTMAAVNTVPSKTRTNDLIKLSRRTDTCDGSCLLHHLSVEGPLVAGVQLQGTLPWLKPGLIHLHGDAAFLRRDCRRCVSDEFSVDLNFSPGWLRCDRQLRLGRTLNGFGGFSRKLADGLVQIGTCCLF